MAGAVLIRLGLAWTTVEVADVANYRRVAETLVSGGRLYSDTPAIYPYPPFWALAEIAALWLSQHTFLPFAFGIELLPILADAGIVYLLYLFTRERPRFGLAPALYTFNPLPILICAVHGQFDALPLFFTLLAVYLFERKKPYLLVALALLAAIALKPFPVLLLPFFLLRLKNWRIRIIFAGLIILPVLASLAPFFLQDFGAVSRELLGYSGYPDQGWLPLIWAVLKVVTPESNLSNTLDVLLAFSKLLFLTAYFALLYLRYRRRGKWPLTFEIILVFGLFYLLYGGLSSQYLLWALPFLLLLDLQAAVVYSLLATAALLAFYNYQWPAIIYRASFQPLPKGISAGLWLACTGLWWLGVALWFVKVVWKSGLFGRGADSPPDSDAETASYQNRFGN
jgi:hypothetical protein